MSFNPTRLQQTQNQRVRTPPPNTGRTHAQIMARHNASREPIGPRTKTPYGFYELAFGSDAFEVRRETMHAGSSIGYGCNETGDRVVVVERGILFAFLSDEEGNVTNMRLTPGAVLQAPRGRKHGYATSGDDGVEILVIETSGYAAGWEQLQAATETARAAPATSAPMPVRPRDRALDEVTQAQAQQEGEVRSRRRAKSADGPSREINANSTNVIGVNPRPTGIPSE